MKLFFLGFFLYSGLLFSSEPSQEEILKFSEQEMKECHAQISCLDKSNPEYHFQWGRASAFYDIIRYIESNKAIPYVGNPSRMD